MTKFMVNTVIGGKTVVVRDGGIGRIVAASLMRNRVIWIKKPEGS